MLLRKKHICKFIYKLIAEKKLIKSMSGLSLKTNCETSAVKSVFTIS